MTTTEMATRPDQAAMMEKLIIGGDLAALSPAERLSYYHRVCESLDLNPLTRPFEYLKLSGRLTLYARKDATEQLSAKRKVSIGLDDGRAVNDAWVVKARATGPDGRYADATGVVNIKGLAGENLANAMMKCETKAARRATLRYCGLGWLDETEVESIPGAQIINDEGEVKPARETIAAPKPKPEPKPAPPKQRPGVLQVVEQAMEDYHTSQAQVLAVLGVESLGQIAKKYASLSAVQAAIAEKWGDPEPPAEIVEQDDHLADIQKEEALPW